MSQYYWDKAGKLRAWLTADELVGIHEVVVEIFRRADDPLYFTGPREAGLPDAAVSRALATFGGRDLYRTDRERAAVLLHAINSSHVFRDGNKRTSVAALAVVLDRNGWRLQCSDDELFDMVLAVAQRGAPFDSTTSETIRAITAWIRSHTQKKKLGQFGDVRLEEFLRRCVAAGGSFRQTAGSTVVWGLDHTRSVRISGSTRVLAEGVVKAYLSRIGLSASWTGLAMDEFVHGRVEDQRVIQQFTGVLYRLAEYDREAQDAESESR